MSEKSYIEFLDDGPLVAEGLEKLDNSKGEELELRQKVAICRCGESRNKPYCDGSHKTMGFTSRVEKDTSQGCRDKGAAKEVKVLKNGPYEVRGCVELEIRDLMGLSQDEPYYLCRCGASNNKPLCDSSHKAVKFTDEKN